MAKSTSIEQYVAILKTIQRFAVGGSLKNIGAALTPPMLERDLRECVNALIDEGRVIRDGSYKLSTYRLAPGGLSGLEPEPNQPRARPESVPCAAESGAGAAESAAANVPVADRVYKEAATGNGSGAAGRGEAGRAGVSDPGYNKTGPVADRGYNKPAPARQTPYVAPVMVGRTVPADSTGSASRACRGSEPRLGETPRPTSMRRSESPPPPPAPPPPPEPEPPARIVTDEERAKFKEYLDQMVPAIVRTEMKRRDAQFYAGEAAEGLPAGDDDWFKEVIEAELDSLDPAGAAAYGIAPAAFKKWRARW